MTNVCNSTSQANSAFYHQWHEILVGYLCRLWGEGLVCPIGAVACLSPKQAELSSSAGNGWMHNVLHYH